jgi:hypothetical protein
MPSGVVQTERRVPRDVFNKLKSQLKSFYGGSGNAGQLMVLEAGLKYMSISPSAADAMFHDMGGWSRDRVLAMFHLNKGLLGQFDATGDPYLDEWQRLFDNKTMIPLLKKWQGLISESLTQPGWGVDFEFDYEEVQAPDDIIKRATLLSAIPGVKVRELRKAAGLTPSTGDKKVDEMVLNLPGPNLDANGQGGFADKNLPTEPGRPPIPGNTRPFPGTVRRAAGAPAAVAGKSVDEILADIETQLAILDVKALKPARTHVGAISQAHPPEDQNVGSRYTAIDALTQQVEDDILAATHTLERSLLDASEGKALGGTMYQRIKNSAGWATFRARLNEILQAAIEQGLSLANIHHAKQGLTASDVNYSALAKELVARDDGGASSIVNTFKKEALAEILKLQQHGSSAADFTKAIQVGIQKWTDGRAKTVALTEATRAYNEGTIQVAEANGITDLLVSDGADHDEPCRTANGQTWNLEQAREALIEHPNCRRAFVPLPAVS